MAYFKPRHFNSNFQHTDVPIECVVVEAKSGALHLKTVYMGGKLTREQVPISVAWAITDFKSQGSTYEECEIDLLITSWHSLHQRWTSLNVQLGRIKSLAGVWLRAPITLADTHLHPSPLLEQEIQRLESLEKATLSRYKGLEE